MFQIDDSPDLPFEFGTLKERGSAFSRDQILAAARAKTDSAPVSGVRYNQAEIERRAHQREQVRALRDALNELHTRLRPAWIARNVDERAKREKAEARRKLAAVRLAPLVSAAIKCAPESVEEPFLLAPVRARKQYVAPRPLVAKRRPRSYMFGQFFGAVAVMLSGGSGLDT